MNKARQLRELFARPGVVRLVGAHDGLSAKLVEEQGFEAIWASGLEISASYAVPDANILTMTQYLERACEMNDATRIPVVADCDTGYGNSTNAIHMVRKYEAAGIAAVCIEDKLFPKVNSFVHGRQELAPIEEFVGKIMACKHAQRDPDFMVIARVEALIAGCGEDEALRRARAYADAGADAILIHSRAKTPDEIRSFGRRWDGRAPLVVVPTTYPQLALHEMPELGIKMVIYANHGLRAGITAVQQVLRRLAETGDLAAVDREVVAVDEVFRLQQIAEMRESERKFLKGGPEGVSVVIPAAGDPTYEPSMRDLLAACPVSMLDINGKSLLLRNRETLNACGIFNITVVTGYHEDRFDVDGVNYVRNPAFRSTRQIDSIFMAEPHLGDRILMVFSDVLFERSVIQRLLDTSGDVVLVIDGSMPRQRPGADYVLAETPRMPQGRRLTMGRLHRVAKIGKDLGPVTPNFEFTGIAGFSRAGFDQLKQAHRSLVAAGAPTPDILSALQYLIDNGGTVSGLEINEGWIEIRSFENYNAAHALFGGV